MMNCMLPVLLLSVGALAQVSSTEPATTPEVPTTQPAQVTSPLHPRVSLTIKQGDSALGDILLELDAEKAPITVLNFLRYVEDGFYDGTIFHMVAKDLVIQGGGLTEQMEEKESTLHPPILNESTQQELKHRRGAVAMFHPGGFPDTADTQFIINVQDNEHLDTFPDEYAFVIFGHVVDGIDVVDTINKTPLGVHPKINQGQTPAVPVTPVVIESAKLVSPFDQDACKKLAERSTMKIEALRKEAAAQYEKQLQELIAKIEQEAGKKMTTTESGLKYVTIQEGSGDVHPKPTDTVVVHYTGWLIDGEKFDSSYDHAGSSPATFQLNGVIRGWTEGVGLMTVGQKCKFIIPPDLAYGPSGRNEIPSNATLVFEVELLDIK